MLLITGASGNVGGELARALVSGDEPIRGLVREGSATLPDGVEPVVGDLNDAASMSAVVDGVRAVFLLSGYPDMPGLLAVMREAGVEHVVLLSSGAVERGETTNAVTRYNMVSEAAVIDSQAPYTILRPSGYMSNALQWVDQIRSGDIVQEPFADVLIAAIDPFDIAAVAARALTSPEHRGRVYRLTGPEAILPADRVRILGAVLDRDLRLEPLPDDVARAQMEESMPTPMVDAFFRYFADGTYDDSRVLPTVREVTGAEPRTFEQWARTHANAFR
jgi:uncharacterized protein YbjT (DUF2867 family)